MKKTTIGYWAFTGLFTAMMVMGLVNYVINFETVAASYVTLGFAAYVLYFNATAKVLGLIAILWGKFPILKEWAYAGLTYILLLGAYAHIMVADGQFFGAVIGLVLLAGSYFFDKKR